MAPDPRVQKKKAKIKWHDSWLLDNDVNGDNIAEWCRKKDFETAKCAWCGSTFKFNSQGFSGLKKHAKSETHKLIANTRKGRISNQLLLDVSSAADRDHDDDIDISTLAGAEPESDIENTQTQSERNNNQHREKRKNPFVETESEDEDYTHDSQKKSRTKKGGLFSIFDRQIGAHNIRSKTRSVDKDADDPNSEDTNSDESVAEPSNPGERLGEHSNPGEHLGEHSNPGERLGEHSNPEERLGEHSNPEDGSAGELSNPEAGYEEHGNLEASMDEGQSSSNRTSGGSRSRGTHGGRQRQGRGRGTSSSTRPRQRGGLGARATAGQRWIRTRGRAALRLRTGVEKPLRPTRISLNDRVEIAEIRMALKCVESNYSYKSMDNMADLLRSMDANSEVFQKYTMKRFKTSALISHGLYPFFRKKLIQALLEAPGYCFGTDASTFHQGERGLSKHVDFVFRFWDEKFGGIVDRFGGFASVGKEPADVQLREILNFLDKDGIPLVKMICMSRDNPNVMKKTFRDLEAEVLAANNPRLVDSPCYLHPTHTAFQKCMEALVEKDEEGEPITVSISSLLNHLFGWFQISTARREDMVELRMELEEEYEDFNEELNQFFLRHIVTRWLESQPCLERLLNLWTSTEKYFMDYLPDRRDSGTKKALKTDRYKDIASCFSVSQVYKTKIRVKFLIFICKICRPFLLKFQAERPQVYQLFDSSVQLFKDLAQLILKPAAFRNLHFDEFKTLDVHEPQNQLKSRDCGYLTAVAEEMEKLSSPDDRWKMRRELRGGVAAMLEHIVKNLPFDNVLLQSLEFLNPSNRLVKDVAGGGVAVAKQLNRFTESEISDISVQLLQYKALQPSTVPEFKEERQDRVDFWWVKIFHILEEVNGEAPKVVMKLVKLSLTISHGQGMVERGFNITKQILHNRNSMSDTTVKGQKLVRQEIRRYGGSEKVPITQSLLIECKLASRKEKEERQKEADEKLRKTREAALEAEALERRKAEEESSKKHNEKRIDLLNSIKATEAIIETKRKMIREAISKGEKMNNLVRVQCNLRTIRFAEEEKEIQEKNLKDLNVQIAHHNSLKHK